MLLLQLSKLPVFVKSSEKKIAMNEKNPVQSTRVVLQQRPQGVPKEEDFTLNTVSLAPLKEGEILGETLYLSLDPYMRSRLGGRHLSGKDDLGECISGEAVSRVLESRHPKFSPGQILLMHSGWQSHFVSDGQGAQLIEPGTFSPSLFVGVLGMPGLTAYAGVTRLAEPKKGDTLVVSAASGPVGATVGQVGKILGCRAVGIAGSEEKCRWTVEEAGFDACINYKKEDVREMLAKHCPEGINIYFDNVGGDILQAAMEQMAMGARAVMCGLIAQYNSDEIPPGPNPGLIIRARATVRGLVVYDHEDLREQFLKECQRWIESGQLRYREDITEGLEQAPRAFVQLMEGRNFGKVIVKVAG